MSLIEAGSGSSHIGSTTAHREASASLARSFRLSELNPDIEQQQGTIWQEPSMLLRCFKVGQTNDPCRKTYVTEADVSHVVSCALDDAIVLASTFTGKNLEVRHEYSLFSQRPDHLVVVDSVSKVPIIAVEDKKPCNKETKLTDHKPLLGQIFDYATAMYAFGNSVPFCRLDNIHNVCHVLARPRGCECDCIK